MNACSMQLKYASKSKKRFDVTNELFFWLFRSRQSLIYRHRAVRLVGATKLHSSRAESFSAGLRMVPYGICVSAVLRIGIFHILQL